MKPIVSFIVPFYGNIDRKLLQRCIHSLRTQGLEDEAYEIIVVDNGERGLGGARNDGMKKASGQYLLFVDADDYVLPGALLPCVPLLQKHAPDMLSVGFRAVQDKGLASASFVRDDSGATASHTAGQKPVGMSAIVDSEVPKPFPIPYTQYAFGSQYMLEHNFLGAAWRHFFRREFLLQSQLEFAESCYHEDEAFVCKSYCLAEKTLVTEHPLYAYCIRPNSITTASSAALRTVRVNDFRSILTELRNFEESLPETAEHSSLSIQRVEAVRRRIAFLTIDYLRVLRKNRSGWSEMRSRIIELKRAGFLPLPSQRYTWKYALVRCFLSLLLCFIKK